MHDQRLVNRLQNYWKLIARGKPMPEIQKFNSAPVEDIWPYCIKVEVHPGQGGSYQYTYQYMGPKMIEMLGKDLTGVMMNRNDTRYPFGVIVRKLDECYEHKQFTIDQNQFINDKGKVIKYRGCFLPFGNEKRGITHFIIGLSDRTY